LITADIIRRHADIDHSSFFVCGPHAMHMFLNKELTTLGLPPRRVRRELLGQPPDIAQISGFPQSVVDATFQMTVSVGDSIVKVPAKATGSILVALERANLAPPSQCRSGECGFCRALIHSGDVFVNPDGDGRRFADRQFNFVHSCSTYPISDLEVEILRRG
jgi:ferredoxin